MSDRVKAQDAFFPLAAAHAAIVVPLAVSAMTGGPVSVPGLVGEGHAFEMFFGFALALVAGYLAGPMPRTWLVVLVGLWVAGRATVLGLAEPMTGRLLTLAFALALAWRVVPRFRHARKWRNRAIPWIVAAIASVPLLWLARFRLPVAILEAFIPTGPVLLFALLMGFMGGRIIAPAAAGEHYRLGRTLEARVQPRLEGALIVLLAIAAALLLVPGMVQVAGGLAVASGMVLLIRLLRWRLWRCSARPDLMALGLGYAWLAVGVAGIGGAAVFGAQSTVAVHLITVGALGTLSTAVMLQQDCNRRRNRKPLGVEIFPVAGLIALAAAARAFAAGIVAVPAGLWAAATAWSLAYLLVVWRLLAAATR